MTAAPSRYLETRPARALRSFVECYWSVESDGAAARILPDGCMDLLFELGGRRSQLVGVMTRAHLTTRTRPVTSVGVRFHPGAAPAFLRLSAREVRDTTLDIATVWGAFGRDLGERVAHAESASLAITIIERTLMVRLPDVIVDPRLNAAVACLRAADGARATKDVAARACLGERQLERLFDEGVGIGPKALARTMRLRAVTRALKRSSQPSGAELAARFGYADQAHFIRDFRALVGLTPAAYARTSSVSEMSNSA